jgi:rubrerythrin
MGENIFVCRTCGFVAGEIFLCPSCDEPLVELTAQVQEEFQKNTVLRNAVGMLQDRRWY